MDLYGKPTKTRPGLLARVRARLGRRSRAAAERKTDDLMSPTRVHDGRCRCATCRHERYRALPPVRCNPRTLNFYGHFPKLARKARAVDAHR